MTKTILITGATDGIGLETAKLLVESGHTVLIHGRSEVKLAATRDQLSQINPAARIQSYRADLSQISAVESMASEIAGQHSKLDVLINNAGVFKVPSPLLENGFDLRFIVNTVAPYLLTKRLIHLMPADGRVVNLSSAAQTAVNVDALLGKTRLDDNQAYGQSKLALTMWSFDLASSLSSDEPVIVSVNPASFLASKMVKDAYGVDGNDLSVGADILVRAALSDDFAKASGKYFDNDKGQFALPHPDALNADKNRQIVQAIESVLDTLSDER